MIKELSKTKQKILLFIGSILALLFLFPIYLLIVNSLKTPRDVFLNTLGLPQEYIFANYPKAWSMMDFGKAFFNSLFLCLGSIILLIASSVMAAWVLVRTKSVLSNTIFLIFIAAMVIPFQSVMLPLVAFMDRLGFLNSHFGLMFMYLGFQSSISIFLFHGFIKSIPVSLEEAAVIDGCPKPMILWKIVFPLLKPITFTVIILNLIWIWNDYLLPSLILSMKELRTIPLSMFFFFGQYTKQWHLAMAALTLAIVPVIVFFILAQKQIIRGITEGSIK
jgi:raffinose/stachyose/melibiose transport system permease protein